MIFDGDHFFLCAAGSRSHPPAGKQTLSNVRRTTLAGIHTASHHPPPPHPLPPLCVSLRGACEKRAVGTWERRRRCCCCRRCCCSPSLPSWSGTPWPLSTTTPPTGNPPPNLSNSGPVCLCNTLNKHGQESISGG